MNQPPDEILEELVEPLPMHSTIGPQIGPAHTSGRDPENGIGWLNDRWVGTLLDAHIARTVQQRSSQPAAPGQAKRSYS